MTLYLAACPDARLGSSLATPKIERMVGGGRQMEFLLCA